MKNLFTKLILVFFFAAMSTVGWAAEQGTAEEAIALAQKGIAYYKANGADKTFAEINNPNGQFKNKDLYLFTGSIKPGGPTMAHGANPKLIGKSLSDLRDVDGVFFVRKFGEVANSKEGKGWVDYKWPHPITKQLQQKSTYIERVDDIYFACGIYK